MLKELDGKNDHKSRFHVIKYKINVNSYIDLEKKIKQIKLKLSVFIASNLIKKDFTITGIKS